MAKRHAAYYREYRRKKKLAKLRVVQSKPQAFAGSRSIDVEAAIEWIESELKVPNGPLAGQPFRVPKWQKKWFRKAYKKDKREAGLSISRKNGKSGFIAAILLSHLVGPLNVTDWRGVVASLTGPLAKELRDAMESTALASGIFDQIKVVKSPPPGKLVGHNGARVDFLAADKATGHAIGADLAIIDEAGLLQENKRALWNALFSSISGRDGRFWGISIQGDGPMFAEMESRAGTKGVHWRKWGSDIECDLDDREAWISSNPGLADGIKSIEYMAHQASRAAASPGNEAHFRAYDLNQPVDPEKEPIVSIREWSKCIRYNPPKLEGDLVIGIDLGGSVSMTCAVAMSVHTKSIYVRGAFGDDPPLSQRAKSDRMGNLYDRMVRHGELLSYPGKLTPVVPFLVDFFMTISNWGNIIMIGCDRFRKAEAEQAFSEARIPSIPIMWRGQGASATADGSHDVRAFQRVVRGEKLQTGGSPMLETAIANSVLRYDGSGNPALDKTASNARIDALSAAVIAAGLAEQIQTTPLLKMTVI